MLYLDMLPLFRNQQNLLYLFSGIVFGAILSFSLSVALSGLTWLNSFSTLLPLTAHHHADFMDSTYKDVTVIPKMDPKLENNNELVKFLSQTVRVLCLVLTTAKYHQERAIHVKHTWGRRCNKLVFISDEDDPELGAISMSEASGYDQVWGKVKAAFKWAHDNHLNEFDWILKADDDSYVILENLRLLTSHFNPNEGLYLGRLFRPYVSQGYMSGGAGYVLSRKGLSMLVKEGFRQPKYCSLHNDLGAEDVEMGRCLNGAGVRAVDTRDSFGRQRFMPFGASEHLMIGRIPKDFWIWSYDMHGYVEGPECCSDFAVSFHYVTPQNMYVMEYLLYRLRPYGVHWQSQNEDSSSTSDKFDDKSLTPVSLVSELKKSGYNVTRNEKLLQKVLTFSNGLLTMHPL